MGRVVSRRGWWRTNALSLGILVVLLPASALSIGWHDWTVAQTAFDRRFPVVAEDGETVELSGATWGPIRSAVIYDTSGMTPPPNTRVIAVAIPVEIDPADPVRCDRPLLIQQSTGRQWNEMSYELGLDYDSTDYVDCPYDATDDYEMIVPFVVPEDVEGPFWVDLVPYDEIGGEDGETAPAGDGAGGTGLDGTFVRFSIDPS